MPLPSKNFSSLPPDSFLAPALSFKKTGHLSLSPHRFFPLPANCNPNQSFPQPFDEKLGPLVQPNPCATPSPLPLLFNFAQSFPQHFDDKLIPWSNTSYARYPWDSREASLYGNYESVPLAAERETGESWATRHPRAYVADYVATHHPTTVDVKRKREGGLREHAQHRYLAAIDGVGPSNRYYELLLTGSLVFKAR